MLVHIAMLCLKKNQVKVVAYSDIFFNIIFFITKYLESWSDGKA